MKRNTSPSKHWLDTFVDNISALVDQHLARLLDNRTGPKSSPNNDERSDIRNIDLRDALPGATASEIEIELHVLEQWRHFIRKALTNMGVFPVDLEDVTDDVIVVVVKKWRNYEPNLGTVEAWINGICCYVYRNHRKKRSRMRSLDEVNGEINTLPSIQPDPEWIVRCIESRNTILSILEIMKNEHFAEIWWLHHFECFDIMTLSKLYRIDYKLMWSRIQSANKAFMKAKASFDNSQITARGNVRKAGGK